MTIGKINQYTCQHCGGKITTIDRDDGVTPFFLSCRVTQGCRGSMNSSMYQVSQDIKPTHEWYKPTGKVKKIFREHVAMGGLLIRKVVQNLEEPASRNEIEMKYTSCPKCGNTVLSQNRLDNGKIVGQCKSCLHTWYDEAKFFQGEMMTCGICEKQEQSDPNKSLNWRVIELDGKAHYVCPKHFPPDRSKASDFAHAYRYVLKKLMAKTNKVN